MNPQNKWLKVTGFVLNFLIAGFIIFAGTMKVLGLAPAPPESMTGFIMPGRLFLIGMGEIITGLLLLIPWTSPLGTLLISGFWGGVICFHMDHNEDLKDIILPSVLLVVTWIGAYLRGSVPLLKGGSCC